MDDLKIDSHDVPRMMYGTAWKENATKKLVATAVENGFRSIDTANQRKHYYEAAVGNAVADIIAAGEVKRSDLFLQTKFTYIRGQDHRLPYDKDASFTEQVSQSFHSSLDHLQTTYIDSYVLHGPYSYPLLADADLEVWGTMESLYQQEKVRFLGVSNVTYRQLKKLFEHAKVKPTFVQNRCFANCGWDREIRGYCSQNDIVYQGFSLLTANRRELQAPIIEDLMRKHQRTLAQIVFRFCLQVGMIVLTGTTDAEHMKEDLDIYDFELSQQEIKQIENIAGI